MIDAAPHDLEIVRSILKNLVPDALIMVFGSRINGTSRDISDLDLAIDLGRKMSIMETGTLKEAFQESNLPFRVDVIDWHRTSPQFQAIIKRQYEILRIN